MICIYEDENWSDLSVLADLRPVFDLLCGRRTLLEKMRRLYPRAEFRLQVREELVEIATEAHADCRVNRSGRSGAGRMPTEGGLFLSGRAILDGQVPVQGPEAVLVAGEEVVGFRLGLERAREFESRPELAAALAAEPVKAQVIRYPWELVDAGVAELERDLSGVPGRTRKTAGVNLVGPANLLSVLPGARIWPGTVISTESGPVCIDRGAQIRPGSFVEGPCYIGPGTLIDGAKVRPGCSFGPYCRVGGEVEASIFQGYANKHHDGFIGHAFVGEWVNLGAMATNSDLKNAYEMVRVRLGSSEVDTGRLKVGCFIGDHAKMAIGTMLNTGAVVGSFANWFEPGLSPKAISRFARGARGYLTPAAALQTARTVMGRRGIVPSAAWERLVRRLYRRRNRA